MEKCDECGRKIRILESCWDYTEENKILCNECDEIRQKEILQEENKKKAQQLAKRIIEELPKEPYDILYKFVEKNSNGSKEQDFENLQSLLTIKYKLEIENDILKIILKQILTKVKEDEEILKQEKLKQEKEIT